MYKILLLILIIILYLILQRKNKEHYENKSNIFFIHIPKTGGTSIEYFLKKNKILNGKFYFDKFGKKYKAKLRINKWHIPPKYFENNKNPYANENLFTVVRNPYDRAISDYKSLMRNKKKKNITPEQLNSYIHKLPERNLHTYRWGHIIPQSEFIENTNIQKKNILKFENLNYEFNLFLKKNKIEKEFNIHKNISDYNIGMEDLDKKSINIINEIYKKDFELFNYNIL